MQVMKSLLLIIALTITVAAQEREEHGTFTARGVALTLITLKSEWGAPPRCYAVDTTRPITLDTLNTTRRLSINTSKTRVGDRVVYRCLPSQVRKLAHARQDKPASVAVPIPAIYRLTPGDSIVYAEIQRKKQAVVDEANRELRELDKDAQLILADAQIPKSERDRKATVEGDHFVFYPKPLPSPEKKP